MRQHFSALVVSDLHDDYRHYESLPGRCHGRGYDVLIVVGDLLYSHKRSLSGSIVDFETGITQDPPSSARATTTLDPELRDWNSSIRCPAESLEMVTFGMGPGIATLRLDMVKNRLKKDPSRAGGLWICVYHRISLSFG